jgi:hypothetical protein
MDQTGCNRQVRTPSTQKMVGLCSVFFIVGIWVAIIHPLNAVASVSDAGNSLTLSAGEIQKNRSSVTIEATKPEWSELTSLQKVALLPLRENWRYLGDTSKRKWIALSNNFQSMAPAEQVKLHERMNDWVALSQQERMEARLNFTKSKLLPKSHKSATWEAYQALSPEDKNRLARAEKEKKSSTSAGLKSSQKPKLMTAPVKILARQPQQALASAHLILDRHTLLLRPQELEESSSKN